MATLDQLSAEQRAIIDLVLSRGRSYDELADMLDMPSSRVRELAREALVSLAPASADRVEADRRGQIADYVLRQQSGGEETATKALLRRSEAGRAWTSSLVDSLYDMYDGDRPEIPEAEAEAPRRRERERDRPRERVREPRAERAPRERRPARERKPLRGEPLSPDAQAAVRRRRIAAALLGAIVLAGVVVGIIAIAGGGDDSGKKKAASARAQTKLLGELLLRPVGGASSDDQGIAIIATQGNRPELIVQAKLPPSKQGTAYGVWLYNSQTDNFSLGAQVTDQAGNYQGRGSLPSNLSKFKYIDVSLQPIPDPACQRSPTCLRNAQKHSGTSLLRGKLSEMQAPQTGAGAGTQQSPGATPGATTQTTP